MPKFVIHIRLPEPLKGHFTDVSRAIGKITVHSPNCHFKTKTLEAEVAQFTVEGAVSLIDLNRAVIKVLDQLSAEYSFYILKAKSSSNW